MLGFRVLGNQDLEPYLKFFENTDMEPKIYLWQGNFITTIAGVDFLTFPPIHIWEWYKNFFNLRKVISQSETQFDLKQLQQLAFGLRACKSDTKPNL